VTVPPFFMGRYAVTQEQWRVVARWEVVERDLDGDPSNHKGDNRPIENITWQDATEFCTRLSRETGRDYGLPSEAMWEYACRSLTQTAFSFGPMISPEVANYNWEEDYDDVEFKQEKNFEGTVPVGYFPANPWGLHEMHGNVWEWCADHWHEDYEYAPTDARVWIDKMAEINAYRVMRGGSWRDYPRTCRSAERLNLGARDSSNGFRVICLPPRLL
jgi:formylglycine-generating enzyme required for sulfatase activity